MTTSTSEKGTVLIVDDTPANLEILVVISRYPMGIPGILWKETGLD